MKLTASNVVYGFTKDNKPVIACDSPATIDVETKDCFSNQLLSPDATVEALDWETTNPATGPIYVNGAEPGDTLKVTIDKITLDGKGVVCCFEGEGTLGHLIDGAHMKRVYVKGGAAHFAPDVHIPVKPMVGVIGTAPADGFINCGTPGNHGGNMDNAMLGEGTCIYLPVAVPGALLALGDVHAVMGDGEIGVTGLEIPAEVSITIEVIKGGAPEYPIVETKDSYSIIASKETLDEAADCATELMKDFLQERIDKPLHEIIMLMSLVGSVEVCQIVDPLKTARYVFPKEYIPSEAGDEGDRARSIKEEQKNEGLWIVLLLTFATAILLMNVLHLPIGRSYMVLYFIGMIFIFIGYVKLMKVIRTKIKARRKDRNN